MNTDQKIRILADAARFDLSCSCKMDDSTRVRDPLAPLYKWIYPASLPDGRTVAVLKILMTNFCTNNCRYCSVCSHSRQETVSFEPAELARLFMEMAKKRMVFGLFLSSASGLDTTRTMDRIIITAEILRFRYGFRGYIHLKILPGADLGHMERAVFLADRVSVNLEAPNARRLESIASCKRFDRLMEKITKIGKLLNSPRTRARSQTTQFVVGAAGESDREILLTTNSLYRDHNMHRIYFSAFQPVEGTPLEDREPVPLMREHRLYQADFLFRKYGFGFDEIPFDSGDNLSLDKDPKAAWAANHPEMFPLEVNKADYMQLLRVPGIGPLSARKIVNLRAKGRFNAPDELKAAGIRLEQAVNFLLINGKLHFRPEQLKFAF